jgi:threonine dehydratase
MLILSRASAQRRHRLKPLEPIPLEAIRAARARIAPHVTRTPLIRLDAAPRGAAGGGGTADAPQIWLKLETLQPIGSFKLRGASNALALADPASLARGVWTASAGNMARGVAWQARRLGVPCTVVAPDHAPAAKLDPVRELGAEIVLAPFEEWFQILEHGRFRDLEGLFVHPVCDGAVVAGNGTIGLEIVEDLPEADTVLVPFGGGGLACGIASALSATAPAVRVVACEVATAAPLAASLAAGAPARVDYRASFVDGIGAPFVLAAMWPLIERLIERSIVSPLAEVASAVRLLAERAHVIAEGAGATPVAAALSGEAGGAKIVCVVSGGNIDAAKLSTILAGGLPG